MNVDVHSTAEDLAKDIERVVCSIVIRDLEHPRFSYGLLGLGACSRLLQALQMRIKDGYPDLIAADVRLIYETWLLGHLLSLSTREEIATAMGESRYWLENAMRMNGQEIPLRHEILPDKVRPVSTEQLAIKLSRKLAARKAPHDMPNMPTRLYDYIFRNESWVGAHPNSSSLAIYLNQVTGTFTTPYPAIITADERLAWAAVIVAYFAVDIYKTHKRDTMYLEETLTSLLKYLQVKVDDK